MRGHEQEEHEVLGRPEVDPERGEGLIGHVVHQDLGRAVLLLVRGGRGGVLGSPLRGFVRRGRGLVHVGGRLMGGRFLTQGPGQQQGGHQDHRATVRRDVRRWRTVSSKARKGTKKASSETASGQSPGSPSHRTAPPPRRASSPCGRPFPRARRRGTRSATGRSTTRSGSRPARCWPPPERHRTGRPRAPPASTAGQAAASVAATTPSTITAYLVTLNAFRRSSSCTSCRSDRNAAGHPQHRPDQEVARLGPVPLIEPMPAPDAQQHGTGQAGPDPQIRGRVLQGTLPPAGLVLGLGAHERCEMPTATAGKSITRRAAASLGRPLRR